MAITKEEFERRVKAAIIADHNLTEDDPSFHWRESDIWTLSDPKILETYAEGEFTIMHNAPVRPEEKNQSPRYKACWYAAENEIWVTICTRKIIETARVLKA